MGKNSIDTRPSRMFSYSNCILLFTADNPSITSGESLPPQMCSNYDNIQERTSEFYGNWNIKNLCISTWDTPRFGGIISEEESMSYMPANTVLPLIQLELYILTIISNARYGNEF